MSDNETKKFLSFFYERTFVLLYSIYMNANRSDDMGHIVKHCFIRDDKLRFEPRLYIFN